MIITIGRQFGSGGKEIGEKVAQKLGYAFYDKELLTMAAEEQGFSAATMQHYDEKPTGSLIYSLYMTGAATGENLPLNQQLAFAQFNVIRKVAQADNCVIMGRCADYVLRDHPGLVSVFVHSDIERRVSRVMERANMNAEQARQAIKKTDRRRSSYYNYFTDRNWGGVDNYDLSVDSGRVGVEGAVELIAKFIELTR